MNLKSLSDHQLLEDTRTAAKNERHETTIVLHHLLEVNERRLFSPNYKSLHEYAVKDLKYGDGSANRRISAMWVLRAVPEVDQKIDSGSLNLTTLSQAQTFFRQEAKVEKELPPEGKRELLNFLENKSSRQVDRELIGRATEPLKLKKKDRVRAVSDTLSELKCLVKDETLEDLEKLRGLLGHRHPDLSMGELLGLVAKAALKQLDPGKEPKRKVKPRLNAKPAQEVVAQEVFAPEMVAQEEIELRTAKPAPKVSRYIPAHVKREVWKRAGRKCQACGSYNRPQIDHIQPHALGGSNNLENLRLLCFHCNQREADQKLGREKMEKSRQTNLPLPPS